MLPSTPGVPFLYPIELVRVAGGRFNFFQFEGFALSYAVLLATAFNYCVHGVLRSIRLLAVIMALVGEGAEPGINSQKRQGTALLSRTPGMRAAILLKYTSRGKGYFPCKDNNLAPVPGPPEAARPA